MCALIKGAGCKFDKIFKYTQVYHVTVVQFLSKQSAIICGKFLYHQINLLFIFIYSKPPEIPYEFFIYFFISIKDKPLCPNLLHLTLRPTNLIVDVTL